MRLKIVSDGTAVGTRVMDDAGRELENVISLDWSIMPGRAATAVITLKEVPVELAAQFENVDWLDVTQQTGTTERRAQQRMQDVLRLPHERRQA